MSTQSVKINGDRPISRKRRNNMVKNSNGKAVLNKINKYKDSDQVSFAHTFCNTFLSIFCVGRHINENWHAISELIRSLIAFHHTFFSSLLS